jgi:hypothetical protein
VLAGAVIVLASPLAACGADTSSGADGVASLGTSPDDSAVDGDGTATTTPRDPEEAMLAYTECMRDHGVDLPDPQVGPAGGGGMVVIDEEVDPADGTFQAAQDECGPIMEDAVSDREIDPEQEAEMREQMLAFAACMREHGVDFPDPTFDESGRVTVGIGSDGPGDIDADADAMQEASQACSEELGGGPFQISSAPVDGDG